MTDAWKDDVWDGQFDEQAVIGAAKAYAKICKLNLEEFMKAGFHRDEAMLLVSVLIPAGVKRSD